jgi:hypothetical protein
MLDGVVAAWDDVVRATSVAIAMPRGSTRFLLALALAPAIGLGFPARGSSATTRARARGRRTRW